MEKRLEAVMEECQRKLNQGMVWFPLVILVIFMKQSYFFPLAYKFSSYLLNLLLPYLLLFYQGKTRLASEQRTPSSYRAGELDLWRGGDAYEISRSGTDQIAEVGPTSNSVRGCATSLHTDWATDKPDFLPYNKFNQDINSTPATSTETSTSINSPIIAPYINKPKHPSSAVYKPTFSPLFHQQSKRSWDESIRQISSCKAHSSTPNSLSTKSTCTNQSYSHWTTDSIN